MSRQLGIGVLVLFLAGYCSPRVRADQQGVWSGLVTDTKCGKKGHAVGDAAGVRNCVLEGAKFALLTSEGGLYELEPQAMVAAYAAEQVVVTGIRQGRILRITSVQRVGQPTASPAPARIDERWRIMRTVRRIHILTRAHEELTGIDPEPLIARLLKEPEFRDGTWQIVDSPANADLTIELNRVPWTWDFTYQINHPPSGLVFGGGKVIAWDGVRAAPGIAKRIMKDLRGIRAESLANVPAPASPPAPVPPPQAEPPRPAPQPETAAPFSPNTSKARLPQAPAAGPVSPPFNSVPSPGQSTVSADSGGFRLRVEVQLVMVEAVVQGPGGTEASGALSALGQGDFRVLEDGVPQPIQHFSRHDLPLAVALVVDASGSVAPYMEQLRQSALDTLSLLNPGDRVALFCFANGTQRVVDLTTDTHRIAQGIGWIRAGGGTNIFDALAEAVSYLDTEAANERRVVILVSDNAPTIEPRIMPREVTRLALQSECVVYSIQTPGDRTPPQLRGLGSAEDIVKETGGEVIGTQPAGSVSAALAAVVRRLKTRYTLGYYPSNKAHDGTFRVIEVRLAERFGQAYVDYGVLARRGYYAPREDVAVSRARANRIPASPDTRLSALKPAKGFRSVHVEQNPRIANVHKLRGSAMLPNRGIGAFVGGQTQQFGKERAADDDRVAALALMGGNHDRGGGRAEGIDKLPDRGGRDGWMIYQAQYSGFELRRVECPKSRLQR